MVEATDYDYVVIGGGFYGVCIALYLRERKPEARIKILERESALMQRASLHNQARVHNGYHYPRSFITAYRSRINLPKFLSDFPFATKKDFRKLYCIGKVNSKVNAVQFRRFCKEIGAKIESASPDDKSLFEPKLIEEVYEVEEYAFDSTSIAAWASDQLKLKQIEVELGFEVSSVEHASKTLLVNGLISSKHIFNATYSGLNSIRKEFKGLSTKLKHEITEMALIEPAPVLKTLGITVMDGPYFSLMPYPSKKLHTLSHVRYTPHLNWVDDLSSKPYEILKEYTKETRYDRMLRDTKRYLPAIEDSKYVESIFEIKTVLVRNEIDDGRPILFESYDYLPNFYSVLGGKLDNIYDILEKIHPLIQG